MYGFKALKHKIGVCVGYIKNQSGNSILTGKELMSSMSVLISRAFVLLLLSTGMSHGYTTVQVSTASSPGLETAFIAATTTQFNANVLVNPFFAGTYQITLNGLNPSYNPLVTNTQLLNSLVAVSTYGYVYGYGGGMVYQNNVDSNLATNFAINCSSPTAFMLNATSTTTFDSNTCNDVMQNVLNALFQVNLSTPPVLPFEP
jgi:hypothetical protein